MNLISSEIILDFLVWFDLVCRLKRNKLSSLGAQHDSVWIQRAVAQWSSISETLNDNWWKCTRKSVQTELRRSNGMLSVLSILMKIFQAQRRNVSEKFCIFCRYCSRQDNGNMLRRWQSKGPETFLRVTFNRIFQILRRKRCEILFFKARKISHWLKLEPQRPELENRS